MTIGDDLISSAQTWDGRSTAKRATLRPGSWVDYAAWDRITHRHVQLIHRVYPRNPSIHSVPRPNKLSSLLFYATTRPAKLVKIGLYLERKISHDLVWEREG
jgi:hypothetical protein